MPNFRLNHQDTKAIKSPQRFFSRYHSRWHCHEPSESSPKSTDHGVKTRNFLGALGGRALLLNLDLPLGRDGGGSVRHS